MRVAGTLSHLYPARLNKSLTILVAVCLLAHALIPARGDTAGLARGMLGQAMGPQAVMMEFFSFSALPLMLVGKLMKDAAAGVPARPRTTDENGTSNAASADLTMDSRDLRTGVIRCAVTSPAPVSLHDCSAVAACSAGHRGQPVRVPVGPPGGWCLVLLMLFMVLPRSGIDARAVRARTRLMTPRFASAIRVFYCPGDAG